MSVQVALPMDLHSPDQLSAVLMEVDAYRSALHDAKIRGQTAQLPDMSQLLIDLLQSSRIEPDDQAGLEELHTGVEQLLNHAPVVHLTLAGLPTRTVKRQITTWFRTQMSPTILVTFSARADLGGGFVATAGSHVYDYSFRRHILDNKQRIAELTFGV